MRRCANLLDGTQHLAVVAIEQDGVAALQGRERADRVERAREFGEMLLA